MIAGRPKDLEFGRALLVRGMVRRDELEARLDRVPDIEPAIRGRIAARIAAWEGR
jgi:hypothetical protein